MDRPVGETRLGNLGKQEAIWGNFYGRVGGDMADIRWRWQLGSLSKCTLHVSGILFFFFFRRRRLAIVGIRCAGSWPGNNIYVTGVPKGSPGRIHRRAVRTVRCVCVC